MAITYAVGQRLTATLLQQLADYTVNKSMVRLVQASSQTLNNNTETEITFGVGSTVWDTNNFHSETSNPGRVIPSIAGYYQLSGTTYFSDEADYTNLQCQPRVNGANYATAQRQGPNTTASVRAISFGPVTVLCNGTTDYLGMMALQANTSANAEATFVNSTSASVLEVVFERPA